jgi:hypothetical protein
MGSIVAYDVCNFVVPNVDIDTFITIGSPLGLPIIVSKIAEEVKIFHPNIKKLRTPKNIKREWINLSDIEDNVALNYNLSDDFEANEGGVKVKDTIVENDYIQYINNSFCDSVSANQLRFEILGSILLKTSSCTDLQTYLNNHLSLSSPKMLHMLNDESYPKAIHFAEDTPLWNNVYDNGADLAWSSQPSQPTEGAAYERLGLAYTIIFTIPGVPVLFYGDEIGLAGAGDPDNKRMMVMSGLTQNQTDLYQLISKLAEIRADNPVLTDGDFSIINSGSDYISYKMDNGNDKLYIFINRSDTAINSGVFLPDGDWVDLITGNTYSGTEISVNARTSVILKEN